MKCNLCSAAIRKITLASGGDVYVSNNSKSFLVNNKHTCTYNLKKGYIPHFMECPKRKFKTSRKAYNNDTIRN